METFVLDRMDAAALRRYLGFLLWHYKVADAFWFIYATERFGQATAEQSSIRRFGDASGGWRRRA